MESELMHLSKFRTLIAISVFLLPGCVQVEAVSPNQAGNTYQGTVNLESLLAKRSWGLALQQLESLSSGDRILARNLIAEAFNESLDSYIARPENTSLGQSLIDQVDSMKVANVPVATNLAADALQALNKQRESEQNARLAEDASLAKMVKKLDSFDDVTWYEHPTSKLSQAGDKYALYISQSEVTRLVFRFQVAEDPQVFFFNIAVNIDGERFDFEPGFGSIRRELSSSGTVIETYDFVPSVKELEAIEASASSTETRIRFYRESTDYYERTVTQEEKRAIKDVLLAYAALTRSE